LLVGYVLLSTLNDLPGAAPHSRLALTVGYLLFNAWLPVYVLMLMVFPNGRLWTRRAWWLVLITAAIWLPQYVPLLLFGDPPSYGHVREALARTLGDPTLALGLWLPEREVWVDEHGRELASPAAGSRGVTYLGDRLAVLVHAHD